MKEKFGIEKEPTEVTKDMVMVMVQQAFERVVSARSNEKLDEINTDNILAECTFLFRRCLIFLYKQGEHELTHALSVMWKSIVTSIDVMLTKEQQKVQMIEGTIEKYVKQKIDDIKKNLEKQNLELKYTNAKKNERLAEQEITINRQILLNQKLQD